MYLSAVILAAGKGVRLGSKVSKPLIRVGGTEVLMYSLRVLHAHSQVKEIVVVVNEGNFEAIKKLLARYSKVRAIVLGGKQRQDSVRLGLAVVGEKADFVLVHDAARPFINKNLLSALIRKAVEVGGAILAVPVKATIKKVMRTYIEETIPRDLLWEAQTPQVFRKSWLLEAYARFRNRKVTDDAALIELLGNRVAVVMGSYGNIKITTPEDFLIARSLVRF